MFLRCGSASRTSSSSTRIRPQATRSFGVGDGPLAGLTGLEFAGLGPTPFAAMVLADLGADIIRIDRPSALAASVSPGSDYLLRGRRSVVIDLKTEAGIEVALDLIARSDFLIEGLRPGVMERLGLGPDACHDRNPDLIYGRMTGWGQTGPLSQTAGHDIDYIALAGALHPIGRADSPPPPPLNLVGDFGGGSMFLVAGILSALLARDRVGGQVVDAAMVDGTAVLTTMAHSMKASGLQTSTRESNLLDGGSPFYDTYECADGRFIAVGALEPQFYAAFMTGLGIDEPPEQYDASTWPAMRRTIAETFRTRSRDEWADHFAGTDACVAPVLSLDEAPTHPTNTTREVFIDVDGATQPAPAPRFSATPPGAPSP
ncbi:MAG: CoA transferase, partial [Acidimicrobiia bacterium]|nr:CoA transferase [Acidimicrobiia bacterium]